MSRTSWRLIYFSTLLFGITMARFALAGVSDRGSYQTSVSIDVPKFHSIAPEIRLSYDSNIGDGPAGFGWTLTATSSISRSSRRSGAPRYDSEDQLWIDGMEVMPVDKTAERVCV